ncbi:uncharacterized protein stbd1 isoform X2 [Melanotaenia boesemani]|uniref:uncharacterized protein stbd1 isoform X2 n=1 Tax=Melanotaenia boesemani TaxID=1250792 RepID=UPI001C051716|nr:uncharacterized protein stbd1 isoform X2 [Melanotaenia boesemani]
MQLKNSSPVATEKRMDLASLFCVIGRHGPAVAVAVFAMVSVLAGFIIYRNVKGKRRKAATGAADGDSRSPGTLTDATLLQSEESRSRVESTDVSDEDLSIKEDADVTLSLKLRNRRAAAERKPYSPLKKDSEPDDGQLRSLMQDSYIMQNNTCTAENVDVEGDVCQDVTEDSVKAAKEDHDDCLKPAVICESHKEKVLMPEDVEKVTTEEVVLGQISHEGKTFPSLDSPACSEENATMTETQDGLEGKVVTSETTESYMEEPIGHTDADIGEENHHPDHTDVSKDGTNFLLLEKEMKIEAQEERLDDQLAASQQEIGLSFQQTSLPSQQDNSENVMDEMPSIQVGNRQQLEPENDPTCDQEMLSNCPEHRNIQGENNEATTSMMPNEESVEQHVFSSIRDPDAAVCAKASLTAAVTSAEMPHPKVFSFQDQKSDQTHNPVLPEVTAAPTPDMTESMKPPISQIPLLSFDQIELAWSSSGAGEESGISSMTVSPALQDAEIECDITPENVTQLIMAQCPESEEQTEDQIQFFVHDEAMSVNKIVAVTPESMFLSQKHDGEEMDNQSAVQVSELKKETDIKVEVVESKDNEKTEISIMAATMDNNEWITDGNYQILPWMNLSVPSLAQNAQTDPLSSKEHHNLPPVAESQNADNPRSTLIKQTLLPLIDENAENDKKVVAVQPMPQNVNVTFCTHYLTQSPYQKVAITGNQQELGNWKEFIPLEKDKDGHWATMVSLPAESHVEWKFVVLDKGEVCRWEECGNRLLDTGYGDDLLVHKWWGFL